MNTFQSSVNRLLGEAAVATNYLTRQATANYAAQRGAEYEKSYQANLEAATKGYTKTGAVSRSKAAKEAAAAAEQAQPGPASKMPFLKGTEEALKADYDKKMGRLNKTVEEGRAKLKATNKQGKEDLLKSFGEYQELAPQLLAKMPPEERWKLQAEQRIKQKKAYENFIDTIRGGNK